MLVRLLYASRAVEAIDATLIESILSRSRTRNPSIGITGLLCYTGDVFLQVIEGGRAEVSNLYNIIVRDPRHRDVTLLHFEEVGSRRFSNWTMGQVNLGKVNPSTLLKYSEMPGLDPFRLDGAVSLALLEEMSATAAICGRAG